MLQLVTRSAVAVYFLEFDGATHVHFAANERNCSLDFKTFFEDSSRMRFFCIMSQRRSILLHIEIRCGIFMVSLRIHLA